MTIISKKKSLQDSLEECLVVPILVNLERDRAQYGLAADINCTHIGPFELSLIGATPVEGGARGVLVLSADEVTHRTFILSDPSGRPSK